MATHRKRIHPNLFTILLRKNSLNSNCVPITTRLPSVAVVKTELPRTRLYKHMQKSKREEDPRGQMVRVCYGFAWKHKAWQMPLRISIPFVFAYFSLSQNSTFRGEIEIYWQCRFTFPLFLFISRNRYELFTS